ncbi:hypothetical protein JDV02_009244 [Purpureocillium takamizusanense]|uniref:Rrn9 domain-containing protein n=1 Tax=Purpureocillium takamizusanense TaxID=2060973 RepID=A0A9Q8QQG6_9HYPO|nr:uncharacterized protein JDV02_009244 [Purpureocillium takamizusanense]UNI23426.1 hypothetical protein JDV02_009244 [Purpureocillium takamizusanense]
MEEAKRPVRWDLDSDEIASVASEDLYRNRPNRWTGPKSSWRALTAEERHLWRSMRQLEHQDLAVHLYDAFALKRQGRDPATARMLTIQADNGNESVWAPPKQWTAWPLREKNVPQEHLVRRQDDEAEQFTIRREEIKALPSADLQDELGAAILRLAKERFRKRKRWQLPVRASIESEASPPGPVQREFDDDDGGKQEDENEEEEEGASMPSSPPRPTMKHESGDDSTNMMQLDSDGSAQGDASTRQSKRSKGPKEERTYEPMVSTNDELSYALLQPSVRHILSQLDKTLQVLHNARVAGLCYLSDSPSDSDSDSQAGITTVTTAAATPRKRSRGRPRSIPRPGTASDGAVTPRTSRRGRPRKVHVPREGETEDEMRLRVARESHRRLPCTPSDRDAAFEEWLRQGDERIERRRTRSLETAKAEAEAEVEAEGAQSTSAPEDTEAQDGSPTGGEDSYHYDSDAAPGRRRHRPDDGDGNDDDDEGSSNLDRKIRRWGLRDWSDVVGAAALAGFPEDVIKRTTRRCADLFGETMVIRRLDEVPASRGPPGFHTVEYRPERIRLSSSSPPGAASSAAVAAASSSSSDEQVRPTLRQRRLASLASSPSHTPRGRSATPVCSPAAAAGGSSRSRSRSSAALLFCPVTTCDRAATGFARRANLRRHMHLVHPDGGADHRDVGAEGWRKKEGEQGEGEGGEEERDSEDEAVGAVHVDGFLRTIRVGRGWRAEDVAERKRKAFWGGRPVRGRATRRGRPQSGDDDGDDDDGDDEAGDDESS